MYPILSTTPKAHAGDLAHSALPGAPVVPDSPRRRPLVTARTAVAVALHAVARAVEPAPRTRRSFETGPGMCA